MFAGGFTTSTDFPVKNAVQTAHGGGMDDAFLLHFEAGGDLHQATYLGGSGADRILGLFTYGDMSVIATGQTSSRDFPIVSAPQPRLPGNTNGFITRISTNLIGVAEPLIGGKDLRTTYATITVGPKNGASSADVMVSSSDPSAVAVAFAYDAIGAGSTTVPGEHEIRGFYFDCLTDQGGADLTFSAQGYPDRVAHVECYPATLQLFWSPLHQGPYDYSMPVGYRTPLDFYLSASRPDNSVVNSYVELRPGADPIRAVLSSSNPNAASVPTSEVVIESPENRPYLGDLTALAIGDTNLTLTSSRTIGKPVPIHVTSPLARFATDTVEVLTGYSCTFPADGTSLPVAKMVLYQSRSQARIQN